ncbi:MAG: KR domain-containing protein [Planctomycetota bacterium]|nr:KR domain-containing protein [Planctomycetota bacterium]
MEVSVLHLVLPPLAVPIVPGGNAGDLGDQIIDSLWQVFSCVREWYNNLRDQKIPPTVLVWAWPGEGSDRPPVPTEPASLNDHSDAPLSLLPSVSALLRCMALELNRSIVLITTDEQPQSDEIRDVTAFLAKKAVQIGDVSLSNHRLSGFEPRLLTVAPTDTTGDSPQPLEGHILSLGGARGIVAEMLNRTVSSQSHLSLVGRTQPEEPNPDFVGLPPQELMRLLMNRSRKIGDVDSVTPKSLQRKVDEIQRQAALQAQLKRFRQDLKCFDYHAVDLCRSDEFKSLIEQDVMDDVEILVSGAGIIQDQSCLSKTRNSFEAVLRTKVMPLCVLLCDGLSSSINTWISFSSIASKSGNPGQSDYAAANELLNTVLHWFSRRYPHLCLRTINWGPWQSSGMASNQVIKAFQARGLEPVHPDDAAKMLCDILQPEWSAVEVSGVALNPSVAGRLVRQQVLIESSLLWRYHSLPVRDTLEMEEWRLVFHESVPYLLGHRKNDRAVVPAALVLCLAADLASVSVSVQPEVLRLSLYVFHGITIQAFELANVHAKAQVSDDGRSGELLIQQVSKQRPHYKVTWQSMLEDSEILGHRWCFEPKLDDGPFLYCERDDVYSSCLFHSGVMARLCDRVVIHPGSSTSWCSAEAIPVHEQLGVEALGVDQHLPYRDLTLIDALLQLLLVQTIETYSFSALPQELSIDLIEPMPQSGKVKLTITIVKVQGSVLEAVGACCDEQGKLLFIMNSSKFTTSQKLLDYEPGISQALIVNPE